VTALNARSEPEHAARLAAKRLERARRRLREGVDRERAGVFWAGREARLTSLAEAVASGKLAARAAVERLLAEGGAWIR